MKIQYARSKLKCIKLNLDTAENGENKNYINNNIHTFNLLLMVSHFVTLVHVFGNILQF